MRLISNATFHDLHGILKIEQKVMSFPWTKEHFEAELKKPFSTVLVTKKKEAVIGYIVFWIYFNECEIMNCAVDPFWQNQKIATALMHHVFSVCHQKKIQKIGLHVKTSNQSALCLYKNFGFFIEHLHPAFTTDLQDAYRMVAYLKELHAI